MLKALKLVYGAISVVFFLLYLVYSFVMSAEFFGVVGQVKAKSDLYPWAYSDYVTFEVFVILTIVLFLIHVILQFTTAFIETKQKTHSLIILATSIGLLVTSAIIMGCFWPVATSNRTPNEEKWIEKHHICCYDYTSINGTNYYVNCSCPYFSEDTPKADSPCDYCAKEGWWHDPIIVGLIASGYFFVPSAIVYFFLTFIYDILFISFAFKRTMKHGYSDLPQ